MGWLQGVGGDLKDPVTLLLSSWEVPRPPIIGEQLSLLALDPGVGSVLHSLWAVAGCRELRPLAAFGPQALLCLLNFFLLDSSLI